MSGLASSPETVVRKSGQSLAYRPDIDGLRAVAVTSVVLCHADIPLLGGGFAGVDVFFVISGFLIGTIIFGAVRGDTFSFVEFYARRARRILPALIGVVAFTMLAGALLLSPREYASLSRSALSALLAVSNFHYLDTIDYFNPYADLDPMLMTWSLGIEEQFYVLLPVILIGLRRFDDRFVLFVLGLVTLGSLALCLDIAGRYQPVAFYLLPTRAWELGVGVMLGIWIATGRNTITGKTAEAISIAAVLALAISLAASGYATKWPGQATLVPVIATAALIATPGTLINRKLLSARVMTGIGLISYSWYLWHWPLLAFLHVSAVGDPRMEAKIATAVVSLGLGYLSWRYIELPFRASRAGSGKPVASGKTVLRYAGALGVSAGAVWAVNLSDGLPSRVSPQTNAIDAMIRQAHQDKCLAYNQIRPDFERCTSTPPGKPVIAVIGDSHGTALAPAIVERADRDGRGWAILTQGSCRPLAGVTVAKSNEPAFGSYCSQFMENALAWVRDRPEVDEVFLVGLWSGPLWIDEEDYVRIDGTTAADERALLAEGLGNAVQMLVRAGKRVHVVQGTPYWEFDPARAMLSENIAARRFISGMASEDGARKGEFGRTRRSDIRTELAVAEATSQAGGTVLSVTGRFCERDGCRYRHGASLHFTGRSHLSPVGASHALAVLDMAR